jgi:hypothetical protein
LTDNQLCVCVGQIHLPDGRAADALTCLRNWLPHHSSGACAAGITDTRRTLSTILLADEIDQD